MYEPRNYRRLYSGGLSFRVVCCGETDLAIGLPGRLWREGMTDTVYHLVADLRRELGQYIAGDTTFLTTHAPHAVGEGAPLLAREMAWAASMAGVGPMAAVAGAIAARVGQWLGQYTRDVVVENGGDIYLAGESEKIIGIYAGDHSPFTGRLGLKISRDLLPLGVCTSSGMVGPSFSYGKADAAVIMGANAALADAVATATANRIQGVADLPGAAEFAQAFRGSLEL